MIVSGIVSPTLLQLDLVDPIEIDEMFTMICWDGITINLERHSCFLTGLKLGRPFWEWEKMQTGRFSRVNLPHHHDYLNGFARGLIYAISSGKSCPDLASRRHWNDSFGGGVAKLVYFTGGL